MQLTKLNAAQAVARARTHTSWGHNLCLNFVADAFSAGTFPYTSVGDALAGWNATVMKRFDRNPPFGVPVYWTSPDQPHGHVALSVGGGRVRSTDCPSSGSVAECAMTELESRWGLHYLGYGLDFCGDQIAGVTMPAPVTTGPRVVVANLRMGASNVDVQTYNRLLWAAQGPMYKAAHFLLWMRGKANVYDSATETVTRDTYANAKGALGAVPAYPVTPGPDLIRAIGGNPV